MNHDPESNEDMTDVTPSFPARCLTGAVHVYQSAAAGRPSPCRHVPSCSTYAIEALEMHGAVRGSWLAIRRLSRCHPWGTQGYDPVPARKGPGERRSPSRGRGEASTKRQWKAG